jgi:hypothetical protein
LSVRGVWLPPKKSCLTEAKWQIMEQIPEVLLEIFRSDRLRFASGDRAKGTPEEYKDAVLSASCHFGTYIVDFAKGTITFHIERASYPNWDETTRVSGFTLEGDQLTWRVSPRPDGSIPVSVFSRMP